MLFISDLHGSIGSLDKALDWFQRFNCNYIIILGDILNHGPRNPIPKGYDPAAVAARLNEHADKIIAIRGNCDSEVDQMLCKFPILAEYNWLLLGKRRFCLSHGHKLGPDNLPVLAKGDGFIYGHTHIPVAQWKDDIILANPGSVTIPKIGFKPSFGYYNNERFSVRDLESGDEILGVNLN